MNYAEKLRRYADWLDSHPKVLEEIGEFDTPFTYLYFSEEGKERFSALASEMGRGDKDRWNDELSFTYQEREGDPDFGDRIFGVRLTITGVCEKKATGEIKAKRIYPATIPENAYQDENGNWYVPEPVVEYECPPILSLGNA